MTIRLSAILCLLLPLLLVGCGEEEVVEKDLTRPIKVVKVGEEQAFGGRWFPGQAKPAEEANLSFRVPGTINDLPVVVGDDVELGDVLARLDRRDYQVKVNDAEASLRKARAGLALARSEFARVARVFEKDPGAVSKSMVDVRQAELDTAKAQVVSAEAAVESARDNLSYTTLRAPFAGTVVETFVENFEEVQAMQQVVRVVDTSGIDFVVQIPETLMRHANKVGTVYVVFDAEPTIEVAAQVKEIGKEASKTTRTYPITLSMEQPEGFKILPGMAGKARGDKASTDVIAKEAGLVGVEIPTSATFAAEGGKTYVWVVDEQAGKVNKREVEVINLTEQGAMVSGLAPGTMIAVAGVNTLVENQPVRILP